MEKTFLNPKLTNNGYQDPMGNDAHQGLELFLDKFHQPTVPSYTIITDPEYYVFLWFHNAIGKLINCPYTNAGYTTFLKSTSVNFDEMNWPFWGKPGIQSGKRGGSGDRMFPPECIDLTPFVREISLPEIQPANAEEIKTLFGNTKGGAFSPYASDGQKSITLQVVDTEYSILDAIFYPWMKDINSPWWYREDKVYSEWATPYPMATLEVQRPRMRYRATPEPQDSRNDSDYTYYSYKYIGVKPTSYAAFQPNGGGVSNLLRQLQLSCDMCIVDLTGDVAGSSNQSTNLGNRTSLIFSEMPTPADDSSPDDEQEPDESPEDEYDDYDDELSDIEDEEEQNEDDMDQQEDGDMPGEDEPEWEDDHPSGDEYPDDFGDDEMEPDEEMDYDEEDDSPEMEEYEPDDEDYGDDEEPWEPSIDDDEVEKEEFIQDDEPSPNEDLDDFETDQEAQDLGEDEQEDYEEDDDEENEPEESKPKKERSFFDKVADAVKNIGSKVADAAKKSSGWLADGSDNSYGLDPKSADKATGVATDVTKPAKGQDTQQQGPSGDVATTTLAAADGDDKKTDAKSNKGNSIFGGIGSAFSTALGKAKNAANKVLGGLKKDTPSKDDKKNDQETKEEQKEELKEEQKSTGWFSNIGSALKDKAKNSGKTAYGAVSNVASSAAAGAKKAASKLMSSIGGWFGRSVDSGVLPYSRDSNDNDNEAIATSPTTTLLGGVMNNSLGCASALVGSTVGQAGNVLGGVLSREDEFDNEEVVAGVLKQIKDATSQIRKSGEMTANLNDAEEEINSTIDLVGELASSVASVSSGTVGELGMLVKRMTTSRGNKPTPLENYVGMVTKLDARKSTSM